MLRGRGRLPVLAEISGPPEGTRAWSLRRGDFASLEKALSQLDGQRVVLLTGEGEAPPVAALGLASAALAAGRRTVLVECDLAKPRLASQVGLAAAPGVHEYLRWEAEPADVLQSVVLAGPAATGSSDSLVCVCAGRPASKTETLLGLQSFSHMVGKLRNAYELVVLTGPSVEEEPGPCRVAAAQADVVVAATPKADAARAVRSALRRLPVPTLGAIVVQRS